MSYTPGNPSLLMTPEMLNSTPALGGQDSIAPLDKVVHAIYFVPFLLSWSWYLTE